MNICADLRCTKFNHLKTDVLSAQHMLIMASIDMLGPSWDGGGTFEGNRSRRALPRRNMV